MRKTSDPDEDEMRAEYDPAQMEGKVRGKYAARYREGTNIILLDPDVYEAFPTAEAANEALRMLIRTARAATGQPH